MTGSNYAPGVTDRDLPGSEEMQHTCHLASVDRPCEACAIERDARISQEEPAEMSCQDCGGDHRTKDCGT